MKPATGPLLAFHARSPSLPILLAILTVVAFAAACSDGGEDRPPSQGTGSPAEEATLPSGQTGATGPGASPEPTRTISPRSLNNLPSYRYELTLEGTGGIVESLGLEGVTGSPASDSFNYVIKGAWIAPDKAQLELSFAGQTIRQTVIGNQQWLSLAGIAQGPMPADSRAQDLTLAADFIDEGVLATAQKDFDCSETEEVNGVGTVKCRGDLEDFNRARDQFNSIFVDTSVGEVTAFAATIWIARDGGYPVKSEMRLGGETTDGKDFSLALALNVTDINNVTELTP